MLKVIPLGWLHIVSQLGCCASCVGDSSMGVAASPFANYSVRQLGRAGGEWPPGEGGPTNWALAL